MTIKGMKSVRSRYLDFTCHQSNNARSVIFGYGFTLFKNPKDSAGLLLRPASPSSNLGGIRKIQQELRSQLHEPRAEKHGSYISSTIIDQGSTDDGDSITTNPTTTNPNFFSLGAMDDAPFLTANQSLIDTFSIIVANPRELKTVSITKDRVWIPHPENGITRNQVAVACTLLSEIRSNNHCISKHDDELPPWPMNDRQLHAARYRRSQSHIIKTNIQSLTKYISSTNTTDTQLVRLEDVLAKPTSFAPNQLRIAIHHILGTRKAAKIRNSDDEDLVYTLWLCSSWLLRDRRQEQGLLQHKLGPWLDLLEAAYGHPPFSEPYQPSPVSALRADIWRSAEERESEEIAIAASYLKVVRQVARRFSELVFADPRWNVDFLRWGWNIVQREGVICPPLGRDDGQNGDESMVFIGK